MQGRRRHGRGPHRPECREQWKKMRQKRALRPNRETGQMQYLRAGVTLRLQEGQRKNTQQIRRRQSGIDAAAGKVVIAELQAGRQWYLDWPGRSRLTSRGQLERGKIFAGE